jgi:dihydroorotate dehydrogenase (NAD+) catalytic subunit
MVAPIRAAVGMPLTVKVGGGDPVAAAVEAFDAGANIVCLTTRAQGFLPDLRTRRPVLGTFGAIGGAWTLPITLRHVAKARAELGPEVPLIATNGARDGFDVARCLLAGASAVSLTSAVMTNGTEVLTRAIAELQTYLDEQSLEARELIGEAADSVKTYEEVAMRGSG